MSTWTRLLHARWLCAARSLGTAVTASCGAPPVLRPTEVRVEVCSAGGELVRATRLPVAHEPRGPRQTDCGGDAQALVAVPPD